MDRFGKLRCHCEGVVHGHVGGTGSSSKTAPHLFKNNININFVYFYHIGSNKFSNFVIFICLINVIFISIISVITSIVNVLKENGIKQQ